MKLLITIIIFSTFSHSFETYPYRASERESLGAILYSIGAKRLWGKEGSVLKHTKINKIKIDHEFKNNEIIRLAKEDIRFKCNVIFKGDVLVVKKALVSKKDREQLLKEQPNCMNAKITQLATKRVIVYTSASDYIEAKTKKYKRKILNIKPVKTQKIVKNFQIPKESPRLASSDKSFDSQNLKTSTKTINSKKKSKLLGEHRVSYISARNSLDLKTEGKDTINTVTNSNFGILYEHLQREPGKGLMANFSLAAMSVNADPNYTYDAQGFMSYEIGYNFNDKFMMATSLRLNKQQYINENQELSDLNMSEFLIHTIYKTSFLKKENRISMSAGGVQTDNDLQGYSLGLRSEIIADAFSFSVFYKLREMYNEQTELSLNMFGLSIGRLF